ncbi:S-adenosyl-L-methionine-dependent methyltransferase [Penicillium robsamsonii]|uniref:S-adenosyl-L-methionine-dependent methyltransferase n=1 Tax=Penicillium robsamsonii TaxID=1792511 RepID=UPI0025488440|nr:S-adenosyl-L-methionine-dependent methyltransferase [Penicillium robsamsonii]KAJ5824869.1 S-adenosyl-L-methionine-dependent methyltransferase [Penicillium robsamsonii]
MYFDEAMRQARRETQKDQRLWGLELDPLIVSIAMNLIELTGASGIVKLVVGSALDSLTRLTKKELVAIDLLCLDHVEDLYVADLKICEELGLLKPESLVSANNVLRPGAPEYCGYAHHHANFQS